MARIAKHPVMEFNGTKYYYKPSGYFKADHKVGGAYMHRGVWEFHNGPIPAGYEIHHVDHNKANNDITNLECICGSKHASYHAKERERQTPGWNLASLDAAREKATEWHGSPEGLQWHREHGKQSWVGRKVVPYACQHCGKTYEAKLGARKKGFCGPSCQSAARRVSGVDDEDRSCVVCGVAFRCNRYEKKRTCSQPCTSKEMLETRKRNKEKTHATKPGIH